jgi:hypothetical protein
MILTKIATTNRILKIEGRRITSVMFAPALPLIRTFTSPRDIRFAAGAAHNGIAEGVHC